MKKWSLVGILCIGVMSMAPMLRRAHKLRTPPPLPTKTVTRTALVVLPATVTNIVHLQWIPSPDAVGYQVLSGTNILVWSNTNTIPSGTNYDLIIVRLRKSSWWITLRSIGASGQLSDQCNIVYFLPPPPPPWRFLEIFWIGIRAVRIDVSPDLFRWSTYTNVVGTNVIIPRTNANQFFRTVTTNQPPITNHTRLLLLP